MTSSTSPWAIAVAIALVPAISPAAAAAGQQQLASADTDSAGMSTQQAGDDIIVTGTRTTGMRAADSPAPIQLLGADALQRTGSPDVLQSLAQQLPSVQAQAFGGDLQAHNLQMRLRGLSPNHTLILVNGKRRHGTANVSVAGGPYGGSAAPDISFIVPDSIDHIEVLQDGAAAQYGTDAIAGVINIIQKRADHGGTISATSGEYFDNGGETYAIGGNLGIAPFENAYLNVAVQKKRKNYSFRGDINPQSTALVGRFPAIANLRGYPYTNLIIGDPLIEQTVASFNAGYDFGNYEFYSFGTYGKKKAAAYENTRPPTTVVSGPGTIAAGGVAGVPFYPGGFQPQERIRETDYAATAGFRGTIGQTTFDVASTFGRDEVEVYVWNSANAQLYRDTGFTPTNFHNGDFFATQWTNQLDLTHELDIGLDKPLNIAAGLEYRKETYGIKAGDPASYYGAGAQSFFGYSPNDAGTYKRNNFSQYLDVVVVPVEGWLIDGAVRHENYSDFGDTTIFKLTSRFDFSDAFAVRGTVSTGFRAPTLGEGGYSGINVGPESISGVLPPASAAAGSLGFGGLAPEKSTNYSLGLVINPAPRLSITVDAYQITIRDRIMTSSSFAGFTGNRCPAGYAGSNAAACLPYNADLYNIYNQLAVLRAVNGALGGSSTINSVAEATSIPSYVFVDGANRAINGNVSVQSFVNGVKMRTRGVDVVVNYATDLDDYGRIDWSLIGAYNENKVQGINPLPSALFTSTQNPGLTQLISTGSITELENSAPKFRGIFNAYWSMGRFSVNLRESYYSEVFSFETALAGPQAGNLIKVPVRASFLTDLELGVRLAEPVKLSIGANNLFNKYPTERSREFIRGQQLATNNRGYSSNLYPTFSPFGINGGYYYARMNVTF